MREVKKIIKELNNGKGMTLIARGIKEHGHIILRMKPEVWSKVSKLPNYGTVLQKAQRHLKNNRVEHGGVRMAYIRVEIEDAINLDTVVSK